MDRLRESILRSLPLEARQEVADLFGSSAPVQGMLATLYGAATRVGEMGSPTAWPILLVYNLDRWVHELSELAVLPAALAHVAAELARAPKLGDAALRSAPLMARGSSLAAAFANRDRAAFAASLMALEDLRRDASLKSELLEAVLGREGGPGPGLVYVAAFFAGFERVGRSEREALAWHAASLLLTENAPRPAPREPRGAILPGVASAGALLTGLRRFHRSTALAALEALLAAGGEEEIVSVLALCAVENSGRAHANLLLADAIHQTLGLVPPELRPDLLRAMALRLLERDSGAPIVPLIDERRSAPPAPLDGRARNSQAARLADALARMDRAAALAAAGALLGDEPGAERARRVLAGSVLDLLDPTPPAAFLMTATCFALARQFDWPAARLPLLRAAAALAAERFDGVMAAAAAPA